MGKNDPSVSVAMATFNGAKFINEQIESILRNLSAIDELIISDDGSKDDTIEIIEKYREKYPIIKLYINQGLKGVIYNFENAISKCTKDIIFLADQDDIWENTKKKTIIDLFINNPNTSLILHNAFIYNNINNENEIYDMYDKLGFSKSVTKNIYKNCFIGCCMAFRKDLKTPIIPFPTAKEIHVHDWWIALVALKTTNVLYCQDKLIKYRIHENNTLGFNKTGFIFKIKKRINMIITLFKYRSRFR